MLLIPDNGILQTNYSKDTSTICGKGKGQKRAFELITSLSILGPSTTSEVADFVLRSNYYQNNPERKNTLRDDYNRIIHNRFERKTGKKKIGKTFPGLIKNYYVVKTGDKIIGKKKTSLYFLTLKGCFFALGFQLNNNQMKLFLKNASRNHLFFAYLNRIAKDTSVDYVRKQFIMPINNFIDRGLLNVDEPITLAALFETIQMEFMTRVSSVSDSVSEEYEKRLEKLKYIEQSILKHTFYIEKANSDWNNFVIEYFYPTEKEEMFFLEFRDGEFTEAKFLYKIMRAIHFGYFSGLATEVPEQTQKIPYSKKWMSFKKMNPEYKSPHDFDKKRHQIVDYLVGYRVS